MINILSMAITALAIVTVICVIAIVIGATYVAMKEQVRK